MSSASAPPAGSASARLARVALSVTLTFTLAATNPSHALQPVLLPNSVNSVNSVITPSNISSSNASSPVALIASTNTSSTPTVPKLNETQTQPQSHTPKGERIAHYLRRANIPDVLIVFLVSALPVVELRAGVPVGFFLGLAPWQTFLFAVAGNLAPILPTMLVLRLAFVQRIAQWALARARRKADQLGNLSSRATALALFVGVPLPGTGAWTGALVAFALGMPTGKALLALTAGVFMAGAIMTALCALGWVGAAIAGVALGTAGIATIVQSLRADHTKDADEKTRHIASS